MDGSRGLFTPSHPHPRSLALSAPPNQYQPRFTSNDQGQRRRESSTLLGDDEAKNRLEWVQNARYVRPGPLSQLIAFAQRSGDPDFLKHSLNCLPKVQLGNTVGYASLISTLSTTNNVDEMFYIYGRMKGERVPLNIQCAAALINTSLRHNKIDRAFEVLSDLKESNARIDSGLVNSFVSYFLERRDVDRLLSVLDTRERGDIYIDRVAILDNMWQKLTSPHEDLSLAYRFIERLTAALPESSTTSTSTATATTQPSDSSEPPHQQHQHSGGDDDSERKEGEGANAAAADQPPQDKWTLVAAYWRKRIDELLYQLIVRGDIAHAQGLVELMVRRWKFQPNRRAVTQHIKSVARVAAAAAGQGLGEVDRLGKMVEEGELEADGITFTALIEANGRLGRKADALRLFEVMRARGVERDAGTYKVLFIMCSVSKDRSEGLRLLALAEQDGMALDEGPLAAVTSTIRALPDTPASPRQHTSP